MDEEQLKRSLQARSAEWRPRRGADLEDLLRRVERRAMRPVFMVSLAGTAALGLVFLACLAIVGLPDLFPGAGSIREHLLGVH